MIQHKLNFAALGIFIFCAISSVARAAVTCDANSVGALSFNVATQTVQYCSGTAFVPMPTPQGMPGSAGPPGPAGVTASGTWCGAASSRGGSLYAACQGLNPYSACPSGYTSTNTNTTDYNSTDTTWYSIFTCVKN